MCGYDGGGIVHFNYEETLREIKLTKGCVALVDDEDYEYLNQWKWHTQLNSRTDAVYASRDIRINGVSKKVLMHRQIMGVSDPEILIDHIDHNGLNNTKANLRPCTKRQNQKNMSSHKGSSSKFVGVSWRPNRNKFRARIFDGKEISLGHFDSEIEAAKAYNEAALRIHGEFANLNKVA